MDTSAFPISLPSNSIVTTEVSEVP